MNITEECTELLYICLFENCILWCLCYVRKIFMLTLLSLESQVTSSNVIALLE